MTADVVPFQPPPTTIETVFEVLLRDIVSEKYPPSMRLPAERELAKQLNASRPTLREALRRLGEWNLVIPKRGSGIVVQPMTEWMIDVLPAYLRYAKPDPSEPRLLLSMDLLRLRRLMVCEILSLVAPRITPEACRDARIAVESAWRMRGNGAEFAAADLEVFRILVKSTQFLPGLWMLNKLSSIYVNLSKTFGAIMAPPENYVSAWSGVLDALVQGDCSTATERLNHYLENHDAHLSSLVRK